VPSLKKEAGVEKGRGEALGKVIMGKGRILWLRSSSLARSTAGNESGEEEGG